MKRDGLDLLGCDEVVGFDYGALLQGAGSVMTDIATSSEEGSKKEKSANDEARALNAAIQADINASNTAAQASVSAQLKSPSAKKDAAAAAAAAAVADQAGIGLSPASVTSRLASASTMYANAKKNAAAKPNDGYLAAVAKAWTATLQKLQNTGGDGADGGDGGDGGASGGGKKGKGRGNDKSGGGDQSESFWTRKVMGPLPGAAVVVGGVGLLGGLGYAVKRIFFK